MPIRSSLPTNREPIARESGVISTAWYRWLVRIERILGIGNPDAGTGLEINADDELTISSNGVSNAMLRDSAALSVIGNGTNATADPGDIAAASESMFLQRNRSNQVVFRYPQLPAFSVTALPSASGQGSGTMIWVYDEVGGATPAFSDGTNWRRTSDRAICA